MTKNDGKEILKHLKDKSGWHTQNRALNNIFFSMQEDNASITIELNTKSVGMNMQNDSAAFEGWALALYVYLLDMNGTIILKAPAVEANITQSETIIRHYRRFLYRAMKFQEQFPWFQLDEKLAGNVLQFKEELKNTRFVNNIGNGSAGINGQLENMVEAMLADKNTNALLKIASTAGYQIGANKINRQLPVGLFKEKANEANRFFPGGKSAIDLWTQNESTISIFELKTQNKMIGMVTELFFYANYIYDMFCDDSTSFNPMARHGNKNNRGYEDLLSVDGHKIKNKVQAFFLYDNDQIHPLISMKTVDVLNQGTKKIQYALLPYNLNILLD